MRKHVFLGAASLLVIAGCGGGGGSAISGGGGPVPAPEAAPVGSARFTVDARTGQVKVEPLTDSRAAFSGGALTFTSSLLLSEGSPERRVLRVTAKNNTNDVIGADGSFRVLFTDIKNANTPLTDLRSLVQTSTIWGTGASTNTLGGQSTATINGPSALDYDEATGTLYATNAAGWVLAANGGTVQRLGTATGVNEGTAFGPGFRLNVQDNGINIVIGDALPTTLVGGASGAVDGDFATARFTDINDFYMIRATGPNDFEGVIADGTFVRRVERTPANPNGLVTTLQTASSTIRGVTHKNGTYYFSAGNFIAVFRGSNSTIIGSTAAGAYIDGLQEAARFNAPGVLRWVGNSLFVADTGNNRVRQLNLRPGGSETSSANWWVSTVSGSGAATSVDGTGTIMSHAAPVGLTKGPGETLFVADQSGHRIRQITPISNRFLENFGDSTANPIETAQLANATDYLPGTAVRSPLIVENQTIPAAGTATLGDWQFNLPEGLKSFSFIVTIEAATTAPGVLPAVSNTGTGTKGSPLVSVRTLTGSVHLGSFDGSLASATFSDLRGICVADTGDMFVTDAILGSIRRISKSGQVTTLVRPNSASTSLDGIGPASSSSLTLSIACSPDASSVFWTQGNGVVRRMDFLGGDPALAASWKTTTIAGLAGSTGNVSETTGDLARFSGYMGGLVRIDARTLLVADSDNHTIKKIEKIGLGETAENYVVSNFVGSTTGVSGDNTSALGSSARFNTPTGLAFSKSGYLYIADSNNSRIKRCDLAGLVLNFAGSGSAGTKDGFFTAATFDNPTGLAIEPSGYLYVSDSAANQIRRISPNSVVTTVAGTAYSSSGTVEDGTGATAGIASPKGIAVAPGGDLLVTAFTRIRLLQRIITN